MKEYNKNNNSVSRNLRKRMTKEEKKLWYCFLRKLPFTVNRQKPLGDYVVDFYIASKALAIEIDGVQHESEKGKAQDSERDDYLKRIGVKVLRIKNRAINTNFNAVCDYLMEIFGVTSDMIK